MSMSEHVLAHMRERVAPAPMEANDENESIPPTSNGSAYEAAPERGSQPTL